MRSHTLAQTSICDLSHSACRSPLTDLGHIRSVTYVCHPLWFVCGHRKGILTSPLTNVTRFLFFHQPGSPKGPKGKKLTKAEKERLKKEEDEKKAKEEGNNRQTLMCLDWWWAGGFPGALSGWSKKAVFLNGAILKKNSCFWCICRVV